MTSSRVKSYRAPRWLVQAVDKDLRACGMRLPICWIKDVIANLSLADHYGTVQDPGNPGTPRFVSRTYLDADAIDELVEFARRHRLSLNMQLPKESSQIAHIEVWPRREKGGRNDEVL